ncbi:hypothetical protein LUZ60_002982 [Juncus effusus]|nr:hypothetical protein LUZ60_002982 [Juncus effusus]
MATIPNYTHLCKLGTGSTGTVSLCSDPISGHLFAIKSAELSLSSPLQHEFQILSSLNSPHIISSLGSFATASHYHLLLDFAPNGSLYNLLTRHTNGRLEEPNIRSYTRDILLGLQYLHSNSVVHGDIKSQNILIGSDGLAKISDFGSAVLTSGTHNISFSGTPAFMAPELARGEDWGPEADMWALGCTVLEMATGKAPWSDIIKDQEVMSAIYRIGFCSESVPVIPDWLSEEAKDFLKKCLKRDPKERWTAEMLLDHPFVCLKRDGDNFSSIFTPQSALDLGVLFSESETEEEVEFEEEGGEVNPGNRIRDLVSGFSGLDWDSDENWILVRSRCEEENIGFIDEVNFVDFEDISGDYFLFTDDIVTERISQKSESYSPPLPRSVIVSQIEERRAEERRRK